MIIVYLIPFILFTNVYLTNAIAVRSMNLTIGEPARNEIYSNVEDIYRVSYMSINTTLNVTAWTNATSERPLLIVIRQEKGLISLQLPNKETSKYIQNVSRILCPAYAEPDRSGQSIVYIDIYTSSETPIAYAIQVNYFKAFILNDDTNTLTNINVSPFAPVFFKYNMQSLSSIVKFTSYDRICTTVSVQRMMCPVFDLKHTVDFNGQYQTMTKISAISVHNENMILKSMYIVISVHSTDKECCEDANCSLNSFERIKNVTVQILPGYKDATVNMSYAITLSVFLAAYIFISSFLCVIEPYSEKSLKCLIEESANNTSRTIITIDTSSAITSTTNASTTAARHEFNKRLLHNSIALASTSGNYPKDTELQMPSPTSTVSTTIATSGHINNVDEIQYLSTPTTNTNEVKTRRNMHSHSHNNDDSVNNMFHNNTSTTIDVLPGDEIGIGIPTTDDNSFSSSEYDKVDDFDYYKETVRNKPNIKVRDLARKQPKLLDRKIMNYPRLIIAIATFYVLPVIQLVLMYQTQLTKSGNEDSCYFNFLCMIKFGPIAAFNNVFSNVGYVLLGIMFIIVVKKRAYTYKYMRRKYPIIFQNYGIPQHFGLFYTMGIGLIMEGILSAAYHTCPSYSNFQFDTSFMYVIGVITIIKLYQCRHPDIHPSSQKVFLFLAICILLNVVGVFYGKGERWFMILYCIFHMTFFFILSVIVYYMRQPKFGLNTLKEIRQRWRQNGLFSKPIHIERLVMLLIANLFNAGLALYAVITVPVQFSAHLLNVFLGNFLLYFLMYLINKLINRERFHVITIFNLIVATIAWVAALYFFGIEVKYWEKKPAESREGNKNCILLNVYDHHDAWHFLSALSMFMTFVVMLTLDDGIINIKRESIAAF